MVFLFALAATAAAQHDAAREIIQAESDFAAHAREHGTRAAFLEFLADDAVMFDPGPVNGQELWRKRPANDSLLVWRATFAAAAASGDLGYDSGPWEWSKDRNAAKPEAFGHFVSVWKKQADRRWKVVLDYGIDHPKSGDEAVVVEPTGDAQQKVDHTAALDAAKQAERAFTVRAKEDAAAAIGAVAMDVIRIYRQGSVPAVGRSAAAALLQEHNGKLSLEPLGGDISSSGDLRYVYGRYSLDRGGATERGHYWQVWRTDANGAWKLALDLERPVPQ